MPTTLETWNPAGLKIAQYPEDARRDAVRLGANLTLAAGTLLGKRTSDSKHYAYDDNKTDGTQTATCILEFAVKTDSSGNVYLGNDSTATSVNVPQRHAVVFVAGTFDTSDLTGYDAAAKADFGARLLPSGYLRIP